MAKATRDIVLIAHDVRSTHNVGSLLRTAEGLGVKTVYFSGYTPYPGVPNDTRLPHMALKLEKQIHKTALGAETMVEWQHVDNIADCIVGLKNDGFQMVALEQAPNSTSLPDFQPAEKIALLLGREVEGIEPGLIALCDVTVEIPMAGRKESFNVVQAAAMALYHCRFAN